MIDRFVRMKEASYVVGLSPSEIKRRVKAKTFPEPTRLGIHRTSPLAWRKSAIEKWIEEQDGNGYDFIAANDNTPQKESGAA